MIDPYLMNRLGNVGNKYQSVRKRVLCVCSAGLLRSPTAAWLLSQEPWDYNTRACGLVPEFALIPFDQVLATWANEIVCMTDDQSERVEKMLINWQLTTPVISLNIPDVFGYRDPKLIQLIRDTYIAKEVKFP